MKSEGQGSGNEKSFFCHLPNGCNGEHHKPKLSVNLESEKWHCWVCGHGGPNILRLLALGGEQHPDYIDYKAELDARNGAPAAEKVYERVRLPIEFRPLCVPLCSLYYRQAIAYLGRRGITSDDILTYKLGYCETGPYAERVVVPSFDEYGELNFFTARAIWKRQGLPYLHGKFDKDIIFNDLLVDWSKPITLVEGPFDAIKSGTNAIPLQGKVVRKRLMQKIVDKKAIVNVALDGTSDAFEPALKIAEQLAGLGVDVRYVDLGGEKDPGDMTNEQVTARVATALPIRGQADLLKLRLVRSGARFE